MPGSQTCATLILESPEHLVANEIAVPDVADDDALLRVEACGLCGTDHEQYAGVLPAPVGVPGHETVGVIEAIGPRAAERWGVAIGQRVAVEVFQSCGLCRACQAGDYRRCERHGIGDMYGFIPADRPPGLWGGYARFQYLAPDSKVLAVDPGLDPVVATLFNPLGAGFRWGVQLPGTSPGDVVAILGPGIRGLSAAAAAHHAGAGCVMVVGKGPGDATRLALAPTFGAALAVDSAIDDPVKALTAACGTLADVVVDVTARAPEAFAQAVALARPGGTVVIAGTRGSPETPGFHPDLIVYKELRLLGALGVDTPAYQSALDLLATGRYPFESLPRRTVPLDPASVGGLLADMGGAGGGERPVHGVVLPWA
ncbi:MAG: zinc-binding dehydrogenase [Actinomycetota bacterium]|nr:zinc-binding dehydrogenase [Actinomycetota bacterium]